MTVRKALIEDAEAIAELLMLASGEMMYKFVGEKNYPKARDFLFRFVKSETTNTPTRIAMLQRLKTSLSVPFWSMTERNW